MDRRLAVLCAGTLSAVLAMPAAASEGFARPGVSRGFATHSANGWHPRPHRRLWAPVALDRSSPNVTVVIQQVFAPPPRMTFLAPTVLDLPVELGIREAKPAQPAVYVLNEGVRRDAAPVRLSAGPRIVSKDAFGSGADEPAFGARIIQLAVPVGAGR